jgi:hypothetical protein
VDLRQQAVESTIWRLKHSYADNRHQNQCSPEFWNRKSINIIVTSYHNNPLAEKQRNAEKRSSHTMQFGHCFVTTNTITMQREKSTKTKVARPATG